MGVVTQRGQVVDSTENMMNLELYTFSLLKLSKPVKRDLMVQTKKNSVFF